MGRALQVHVAFPFLLLFLCSFVYQQIDAEETINGAAEVFVRCRICGAKAALKSDYIELHDTTKAVATKRESVLGPNGEVHTFVNPSQISMELAAFRKAFALESEAYTTQATFFDNYNWRELRCNTCKRHLGWKYHHNHYQQCLNEKSVEVMAAEAKKLLTKSTSEEKTRREEIVRQVLEGQCITTPTGWWTYQICYKKEVRQYHEEPDGSRPSDWSMGVYVPSNKMTVDTIKAADLVDIGSEVVQYFAGGQHCDENGALRSTRVSFTCCASKPKTVGVDKIEEPSLCSYRIRVCVPELCEDDDGESESRTVLESVVEACKKDFTASHADEPASFVALRWSTVISEDSSELSWAKAMKYRG